LGSTNRGELKVKREALKDVPVTVLQIEKVQDYKRSGERVGLGQAFTIRDGTTTQKGLEHEALGTVWSLDTLVTRCARPIHAEAE
jgi:hypothetical protein